MPYNHFPFFMPYINNVLGREISENELMSNYISYKEMYPLKMKHLCLIVEREIDRYEYYGSFIYDEYPDKVTIYGIVERVYKTACDEKCFDNNESPELIKMIIEVMIYNEIWERKRGN